MKSKSVQELAEEYFFNNRPWLCYDECVHSFINGAEFGHASRDAEVQALKDKYDELMQLYLEARAKAEKYEAKYLGRP